MTSKTTKRASKNRTVESAVSNAAKASRRIKRASKPKTGAIGKIQEVAEVWEKVREIEATQAIAKEMYASLDELNGELRAMIGIGNPIELPDGRTAVVVDQFAEKDVVWKAACVRRFELKVK